MAHVFGLNLKNNPDDLLRSPDTVDIWDRYIVGGDDQNSERVRERRAVLRHIALFKRFGFGRPFLSEAQCIAKIIEEAYPSVTWPRFQEIIKELRTRRVLQGEYTLYLTPKALHIKQWIDWWDTYGEGVDFAAFVQGLPGRLTEWFYEMFRYARGSQIASRVVEELLSVTGPFVNSEYMKSTEGSSFFSALADADPGAALRYLQRTVGTWSKDELYNFTTGRRETIWALERIAIWRELFPDAARLLLALGEAENETWSNNASGVFEQLFSLGYGRAAPTEAYPNERFPILKEALESDSKERRVLGLRACDQALESEQFIRAIGAEYQGIRREPQLWRPSTYGELFDAYRHVWHLLRERLDVLPEDEHQRAVDILLKRSAGLAVKHNLTDMVVETIEELADKPSVDKGKVLTQVIQILHYNAKKLPEEGLKCLEELKERLTGSDFSSLLKRYVGMDLLEDKYDEEGGYEDQTRLQIEELAEQAVNDFGLLQPELSWLVTAEARNGFRFGYELGKRDKDFSLLKTLLETQRNTNKNASLYFLGGYFRALFEKDQQKWEKQLDTLVEDNDLNNWVPELTWRSGISDQAALRILGLAEKGIININHFRMFIFGGVVRDLSENIFKKWIKFLLCSPDTSAVSIVLDLYHFFYLRKESKYTLPEDLSFQLLTHQSLFQKPKIDKRNQMDDYHWTEIGKKFVRLYPKKSLELANKILEHFGEEGTILERFHSQGQAVLNEITQCDPKEVWKKITIYLGPPIDSRAFHIKEWLRGGEFFKEKEGALSLIPREEIFRWVDEDVENRAWYLASFVPKRLFRQEGKICLAREVLIRYGEREDVRRNYSANFYTEGWSGPASLHFQERRNQLIDFKKNENNKNVIRWIDEHVASLDRQIEQSRIQEERTSF